MTNSKQRTSRTTIYVVAFLTAGLVSGSKSLDASSPATWVKQTSQMLSTPQEPDVVAVVGSRLKDRTFPAPVQSFETWDRLNWAVHWDERGHLLTSLQLIGDPASYDYAVWIRDQQSDWQQVSTVRLIAADPWMDLAVLKWEQQEAASDWLYTAAEFEVHAEKRTELEFRGLTSPWSLLFPTTSQEVPKRQEEVLFEGSGILDSESSSLRPDSTNIDRPLSIYDYGGLRLIKANGESDVQTPGPLFSRTGKCIGWYVPWQVDDSTNASQPLAMLWNAQLQRVAETLVKGEIPEFGFLGVRPREISPAVRKRTVVGISVYEVGQRTPALEAGLQFGDVVTHVDRRPILTVQEFLWELGIRAPGQSVELRVVRGARTDRPQQLSIDVELAKRRTPDLKSPDERLEASGESLIVDWATSSPQFSNDWDQVDPKGAVVILAVAESSTAWESGVRPGQYVSHVNGVRVRDPGEFWRRWNQAGDKISFSLYAGAEQPATRLEFDRD